MVFEDDDTQTHTRDGSDEDFDDVNIEELKGMISGESEESEEERLFLSESDNENGDQDVEMGDDENVGSHDMNEVDPELYSDNDEDADEAGSEPMKFDFSDDDEDYDPNEDDNLLEDEFEFKNILRELSNMKPKRRKGTANNYRAVRNRFDKVSVEVRAMLSEANEAFVRGDYQVALETYLDVVKSDPKNFSAYKTIGEIYRSQGKISKCCNFWILAAHLHPWDTEFWNTVGDLSYELGHIRQSMYCYSRAVKASKGKNHSAVFKRGVLFRETEQYTKATASFLQLLKYEPTNEEILKELIIVFVNQNRINEAIDTYSLIFDQNVHHRIQLKTKPGLVLRTVTFGWSELNILTELYAKRTDWTQGVKTIKVISRWIQGRENQVWWNELQDDSEFDLRRFQNSKFNTLPEKEKALYYDLPIDIRVKLGLFRLNSGSTDELLRHFEFLLESDTHENADLFYDVGRALEDKMIYTEALKFFSSLSHVEDYYNTDLIFSIGKCLLNAHHYEEAKKTYEACLESDPQNLDVLTNLVEIGTALDDQEYVDNIIDRIYALQEVGEVEGEEEQPAEKDNDDDDPNLALIEDLPRDLNKSRRLAKLTDQEWYQKDEQLTNFVIETFKRAQRLLPGLRRAEKFATDTWIMTLFNAFEILVSARGFFSNEKCEPFKKLLADSRNHEPKLNRRILRITRVREQTDLNKRNGKLTSVSPTEEVSEFRGKNFHEWFDFAMELCLALGQRKDESAFVVLQAFENANCFEGEEMEKLTTLVGIALSAQFDEYDKLSHYTRFCLFQHQFSSTAAKLFLLIHKGRNEIQEENHSSQQKFFLRQIKAFDSLRSGHKIPGMANIYVKDVDTSHEHPLLNYVYAGLLLSSKSYISHLAYIQKLVDDGWQNEPMLYFCLALGHLHRAMNRLANNKNLEILQGISFLMKYSDMKLKEGNGHTEYDIQEVDYNFGRAFHMLGLASLAIVQYEKVLKRKIGFLEAEASYNLYLIQNIYGSGENVELMTV